MNFYVYTYKDPQNEKIFYVGKGKRDRANSHLRRRKSRLPLHNSHLQEKIDSLLLEGHEPIIEIVKYFSEENEAFEFETSLIQQIGLQNLTNKTDVAWPCKLTPDLLKRRGNSCRNNPKWRKTMQSKEHREKLSKAVKKAIDERGGRPALSEAHREAVSRSLKGKMIGKNNPSSKNTPEQVYAYLEAVMNGAHWKIAAKEMGIANAFSIIHRRTWQHVVPPEGYKTPCPKPRVNQETIDIVMSMLKQNHTRKQIAEKIGFSATTVNNIIKTFLSQ